MCGRIPCVQVKSSLTLSYRNNLYLFVSYRWNYYNFTKIIKTNCRFWKTAYWKIKADFEIELKVLGISINIFYSHEFEVEFPWTNILFYLIKWSLVMLGLTWWMGISFKVSIKKFQGLRCKWRTTFSLFRWFHANKIGQMTLPTFVMIPMPNKQVEKNHNILTRLRNIKYPVVFNSLFFEHVFNRL